LAAPAPAPATHAATAAANSRSSSASSALPAPARPRPRPRPRPLPPSAPPQPRQGPHVSCTRRASAAVRHATPRATAACMEAASGAGKTEEAEESGSWGVSVGVSGAEARAAEVLG
jgi:hypothetical protein